MYVSTAGSCHSFTSCCDPAMYTSCRGDPPDCYCDQICYQFNDCCNDISSAGNCLGEEIIKSIIMLILHNALSKKNSYIK